MTKAKKILALFLMIACIAAGTLIGYHTGVRAGSAAQAERGTGETDPAETALSTEAEPAEINTENTPGDSSAKVDMSGDYTGDISCPLPPIDSSYRLFPTSNDDGSCILANVENIDDANIRFNITSASPAEDGSGYTEDVLFPEHIAHYNGEGYYEYYDEEYHIYLKFNIMQDNAAGRALEVYGAESFFDPGQYDEPMQYKGISGNLFHMGIPGAG